MNWHAQSIGTTYDGNAVRLAFDLHREVRDSIHILPQGPLVLARDGRAFTVEDAPGLIASVEMPLFVDWEHRSEFGDSRAAGWIDGLYNVTSGAQAPGIWGRVKWTDEGRNDGKSGAYRYLSPVVLIDDDRRAKALLAVALTNRPALRLEAINGYRENLSRRLQERRLAFTTKGQTAMASNEQMTETQRLALQYSGPALTRDRLEYLRRVGMTEEAYKASWVKQRQGRRTVGDRVA